jgi:hypothetical protein
MNGRSAKVFDDDVSVCVELSGLMRAGEYLS